MTRDEFTTRSAISPTHRMDDGFDTFWSELLKEVPPDPPMPPGLQRMLKATARSAFLSGVSWSLAAGTKRSVHELKRLIGIDPQHNDN